MKFSGYFVNVYLVDRAYGGPEEGGWWFDYGEAVRSFAFSSKERAQRALKRIERVLDCWNGQRRSDIGSVISEGRYQVQLEKLPAADWPERDPHYE